MKANKNNYLVYTIGVYAQDLKSTLVFNSKDGKKGDEKYTVQDYDTVIPRIYTNMFQYVTMPIMSHLQSTRILLNMISVITEIRQLVLSISSESHVLISKYHLNFHFRRVR